MTYSADDYRFMRRAIQLARNGLGAVSPNPVVGCVIVAPDNRIIGEGWHRLYGHSHAEVEAVNSVPATERHLLPESTFYVTLEPCSHYGKTPPCAKMLAEIRPRRVVVAVGDPSKKVAGKGFRMLEEVGVAVECGLLERDATELNSAFMKMSTVGKPYVIAKWAMDSNELIDGRQAPTDGAAKISGDFGRLMCHRLRGQVDAILVGSVTFLADSPRLTVRYAAGRTPRRFIADRRHRLSHIPENWTRLDEPTPESIVDRLASEGVSSVLVEGGKQLLEAFLNAGIVDEVRIERNTRLDLSDNPLTVKAPAVDPRTH